MPQEVISGRQPTHFLVKMEQWLPITMKPPHCSETIAPLDPGLIADDSPQVAHAQPLEAPFGQASPRRKLV